MTNDISTRPAPAVVSHRLMEFMKGKATAREPISTLRRADWLCVVDGWTGRNASTTEREAEIVSTLERSGTEVVRARRRPVEVVSLDQSIRMPLESLRDRSVALLSGVARPESIHRTLESLGAHVVEERRFRDHHKYAPKDCRDLGHSDLLWITTEKDALKILPEWLGGITLWVLRIEVEIDEEDAVLARLEGLLQAAGRLAAQPSGERAPNDLVAGFSVARVR